MWYSVRVGSSSLSFRAAVAARAAVAEMRLESTGSPQRVFREFPESSLRPVQIWDNSSQGKSCNSPATATALAHGNAVRSSHSCSAKMGWPPVCLPACLSMKGTQRYKHRRPIWSTASLFLVGQAPPLFVELCLTLFLTFSIKFSIHPYHYIISKL